MANSTQLPLAARAIFDEALRAVDAGAAVGNSIRFDGQLLGIGKISIPVDRPIYAVALGKAAPAMAAALQSVLGEALTAGVITSTSSTNSLDKRWQVFAGGHPLPNVDSLRAAAASISLLHRANADRALIIFLVSGGGSAMLEMPVAEAISLDDLRVANKVLVRSAASIGEINCVRRGFSAVKGGKLAAMAPQCDQITLVISDVPAGEEQNVASGPTVAPLDDDSHPMEIVERYGLRSQLPYSIIGAIENARTSEPACGGKVREQLVLLDNQTALNAAAKAARALGFTTEIGRDICDQPIAEGCELLVQRMDQLRQESARSGICLISGGEFACPVRGAGIGGRNLETALRLANCRLTPEFAAICAGTDGIDGNSPAAGAIIDNTTIERAGSIGLDANDFLRRSDAYSFFVALGDVINTGPTGTNVRDIRILLT